MHSRIREIRKAKGLTLQEVADRIGTTAQTVGRLETGMRTLSINWVNRIAEALDCDAADLLAIPEGGDLSILGSVRENGRVSPNSQGTLRLRFPADDCFGLTLEDNIGEFRKGDIAVFCRGRAHPPKRAIGRIAVVHDKEGRMLMGRLLTVGADRVTLAPGAAAAPMEITEPGEIAVAVLAARYLDDPYSS